MSCPRPLIRRHIERTKPSTIKRKSIMSAQTTKSGYMLLFRGNDWHKGLAPEEMQRVVGQWKGWFDRLTEQGTAIAGNPLEPEGKIVSGKNGRVVADGPFAESKEAIGGYFLLQVDTLDEAVAIAQQCPVLEYGSSVGVRPIAEECPTFRRVKEQLADLVA